MKSFGTAAFLTATNKANGLTSILPYTFIILVLVCAVMHFVLHYTIFGRGIYAIGGNPQSAHSAGCLLYTSEYGANGAFVFADSGLNQNPTPEELSAIAASSAESFQLLVQEEPVVAMLSHSTKEMCIRDRIMPVNQFSCDAFVERGGRIPAPIHSFKN